jgi:hypothetical protein
MSGQQIGSTIGAIVGSYFGPVGQAIGAAVGGYIGGVIDPTEIFGPRLTDALNQTARDGVPRAYGYGTFPCAGNIIWCSDLRERKKTEGGKGSTTETITYQYFRSYAIAVCEGPADGNGIAGYRIIKRNGKVVYDTRTNTELSSLGYSDTEIAETRAAQSKFINKARFYYGISDQEPDPTIQAVKGTDDVPGYSYTAYMVVTDDDVTELRGAVPQYEFVVSVCGDRTEDYSEPGLILVAGATGDGGSPMWAMANEADEPEFTAIPQEDGATVSLGIPCTYGGVLAVVGQTQAAYSDDMVNTIVPIAVGWESNGAPDAVVFGHQGILTLREGFSLTIPQMFFASGIYPTSFVEYTNRPTNQEVTGISYTGGFYYYSVAGGLYRSNDLNSPWVRISYGITSPGQLVGTTIRRWAQVVSRGATYALVSRFTNIALRTYELRSSSDGGEVWDTLYLSRHRTDPHLPCQFDVEDGAIVVLCTDGGVWTSRNNFSEWIYTGIDGVGNPPDDIDWRTIIGTHIRIKNGRVYVLGGSADSDLMVISLDYGLTWGEPISIPIGSSLGFAISSDDFAGLDPIPDAPGYYIDPSTGEVFGPSGTVISECAPTLAEIVEDQCALRDVTTVDVSDLEGDDVLGFRIANTSSPQKNILAAQPGYFFDSSEFDGVLHFPKRGGEDSFHIPFDEMVMREGETVQWERTQEAELLRKVTFTYFDPRATYTPTSQTGERRAGTIQAMGETASQLPLVGTGDWAAKAADINLKSAWYEPDECTFPVSLDWAELVPAAVGTIEDERGTIHRVRILDIKDDGLIRLVKARRTDASAYQSNASGKPIPLPTFPGSDIRGPTTSAIFNIPAVLDSHDRPGFYWAATGSFTSWIGAVLQVQRAGQWVTLAQTVSGATVGTLVDDLPYHEGDIDNINTLSLRINSTLETVTYTQLLSERNPFVIAYTDGTGEIVQFQEAELDSSGVWNCTRLLRGRLNTVEGLHLAGARIAALDSLIQFVDLRPDDLGKTLLFRVISSGTDPDTSIPFSVTFDRIWSSTEWEVAELEVARDGDDFTVSWVPRHRLGTDVNPIRSGNWDGFLVRYQYADQFFEEVITETSKTYNLPGASDVEFTVFQLNRLTGAGPGVSVTHE